jgi:hypothetical protein
VYGSGCFRGSGGDGMIAKALHYKSQGYKAIKMQMAHTNNLRGDVDNVKRMREALGPDIDIMIDINQGWTADVAINQGRKIVDYDIYWLEEPVPADDFKGYMRVAERCRSASSAARRISRASTCGRSSRTRAFRSCSPIRCAAATPTCARSRCWPTPGACRWRRIFSRS